MTEIISTQKQFITNQQQTNDTMNNSIKELTAKVDEMTLHNRMLEGQITKITQFLPSSNYPQGKFLGKPETNPAEHANAIVTRSGKEYGSEKKGMEEVQAKDQPTSDFEKENNFENKVATPLTSPRPY